MVNDDHPVVISISELLYLKDANKDFEILFLNKTSTLSPRIPFTNYLFIRNLHPEDSVPVESDDLTPIENTPDFQVRIESVNPEYSTDLLKGPSDFRDPALRSQKISKEFRKKIFGGVTNGPWNDFKGYRYKMNQKGEEKHDFLKLNPNEIRPILEISNKQFYPGVCQSQEQNFPFYGYSQKMCSQWGENAGLCLNRESLDYQSDYGECRKLQSKFSSKDFPDSNKAIDFTEKNYLYFSELIESIKFHCRAAREKSFDLYDKLFNTFHDREHCAKGYQGSTGFHLQEDFGLNMVTKKCNHKTVHLYRNFFDVCYKIETYFPKESHSCSDQQQKKEMLKENNRQRGSLYQNFIEVFANQPPTSLDEEVKSIKDAMLPNLNEIEIFSLKLSLQKDPSIPKNSAHILTHKDLNKVTRKVEKLVKDMREFTSFKNKLRKMDLTVSFFCPFVHASYSMHYINFRQDFQPISLSLDDIKTLYLYIYIGLHRFYRGDLGSLVIIPSKFDIFRETTPEYLPEIRLFPNLAFLIKNLGFTFKKFFSSLLRKNKKFFDLQMYNTLFTEIGAGHSILSKQFQKMVNPCRSICPSPLITPVFFLLRKFNTSQRCDILVQYKNQLDFHARQTKTLRNQFLFLIESFLDKEDVQVCHDINQKKDQNFILNQEIKLLINEKDYYFSFPLSIGRDLLVFEHRSLDLGIVTQPNVTHLTDVFVNNRARVPIVLRRLSIFSDNPDFDVKLAMTYREHVLIPFQKERFVLCKIMTSLKMSASAKGPSRLEGFLEVEILAEGYKGLIRERLYFRMSHAKDLLQFLPGNRLSMETDGKDIEMVNSSLDDYRRFVVHIQNTAPYDLFLENYQLTEKKHLTRFYEFAFVNTDLVNDPWSRLTKRKNQRECHGENCNKNSKPKKQNGVKNSHFKHLRIYNPNQSILFEEKQIRFSKKNERHFLTIDQKKARDSEIYRRSLIFSFWFLNSFMTTKLEFVHQRLDCTKFKRMPRSRPTPQVNNCFKGMELNFGYYSMHVMVRLTRNGRESCT